MKPTVIRFLQMLIAFSNLSIVTDISAQETNDGVLRPQSFGRVTLALEITNRPNPTLTLINRGGSSSRIPAFLEEALTRALSQKRNIEFPVCLIGGGDRAVTVSVSNEGSEEMVFAGENGEKIPYGVSIKGNQGSENVNGKKAQYKRPRNGACDEDSALRVGVTLTDDIPLENTSLLVGKFRLTITAE